MHIHTYLLHACIWMFIIKSFTNNIELKFYINLFTNILEIKHIFLVLYINIINKKTKIVLL
jgi:hypothetical protein